MSVRLWLAVGQLSDMEGTHFTTKRC